MFRCQMLFELPHLDKKLISEVVAKMFLLNSCSKYFIKLTQKTLNFETFLEELFRTTK